MGAVPTVLIADDETIFAMMLTKGLEHHGFTVCASVSSGEAAVHAAKEHCPAYILLDIHLNGRKNGFETAREIRRFCTAPVLFITGYPEDYVEEEAGKVENARILYKPLNAARISEVLKELAKD